MTPKSKQPISNVEINMETAFIEIEKIAECTELPKSVADKAKDLYKQVKENKQFHGLRNVVIVSACVYIASRREKTLATFKEICAVSNCSKKSIGRAYVRIVKILQIDLEPADTHPFLKNLCYDLDLQKSVWRVSHYIFEEAKVMQNVGQCDHRSLIAAAVFMASQLSTDKRTRMDVENISGVAGAAIQEAYRLMYPHAAKLVPSNLLAVPIESLPQI